jgi:septum site-determining protein MinC
MMSKTADTTREPTIEIRFGQVGLAQIRIRTKEPRTILDYLSGRVAAAPRFFERAAVCLDLSCLHEALDVAEVRAVLEMVRRAGMLTMGLIQGGEAVETAARELDLPLLAPFQTRSRPEPVQSAQQPRPVQPSLMHHHTVRSGQRIYARDRDLVVTATVGAGAELIADGCVHVYGPLRGRAMAGVRGNINARVFCQSFHAEIVSIAGVFRVFEIIPEELAGKPVQAWLDGEDLHFARFGG